MEKTPLPMQASLIAGTVPPISPLVVEPVVADAPTILAATSDSLALPPEAEPPRA